MIELLKKRRDGVKVKLVAVAKDEAAYLPEWIHHHLLFGFDEIEVYVNRSSDNSLKVLSKISKAYSQVKYTTADWIDLCPDAARSHIQQIVYSLALHKAKEDEGFDYVMFIDVDEFYTPTDMKSDIKSKLAELKYPDSVSFQWFNELGTDEPFSPLAQNITGCRHKLLKSIISTKAPVNSMSLHLPRFKGGRKLMSNGDTFKPAPGHHEQLAPGLSKQRDVMIVHRMFRSPLEYVSLLSRGRPSKTKLTIKTNRFGYNVDPSEPEALCLDKDGYDVRQKSLTTFIEECDLVEELKTARDFVVKRYAQTLNSIDYIPISAAKEATRAFRFCDEKVVKALNKKYASKEFLKNITTPVLVADLAKMFVSIDMETAKLLIAKARELHPTGPQIQALYNQICDC